MSGKKSNRNNTPNRGHNDPTPTRMTAVLDQLATGATPQSIDVALLDRHETRKHYRGLNLTLFRQGCTHRPIRTRT